MKNERFESKGINKFSIELPLIDVHEVKESQPASFFAYHGSSRPFLTAIPSENIPVMFYTDKPEVGATYPWGKFLNELVGEANKYRESPELIIAQKILVTNELNSYPWTKKLLSPLRLNASQMEDSDVKAVNEKLKTDQKFRAEAERNVMAMDAFGAARDMTKKDVVDHETGPMGSVREYLVSSENPAIFDFKGHTWGDLPDENNPEQWLVPSRRATTEDLRPLWDSWIKKFFDNGHDVLIIENIRDVGDNMGGKSDLHTTIAVSKKAKVEVKQRHS